MPEGRAETSATGRCGVDGFLFVNRYGNPMSPGYVTHAFRKLIAGADLPPIRLHDLRHGAASLSLAAGNDLKVVQAMLGHSSIVLTADTYTSVLPCLAHQAAEATANLVMKAARRTAKKVRRDSRKATRHYGTKKHRRPGSTRKSAHKVAP
ncbi:tyrosine-type recombinase/integrase [Amycolatopsis camponoti]|nr:tyrosine-type recombinase/integrase [Amycolatopsis camponoti]